MFLSLSRAYSAVKRTGMTSSLSLLAGAVAVSLLGGGSALAADAAPAIDTGDTAWMLTSTALVLMMTIPGLGLFYAGMARKKNGLATKIGSAHG
mgnify:CR=1 FL=1